jgi:hypothetical protein
MPTQAILIQCHKNPEQVNMLLDALQHPDVDIFVHVDKKSDIGSQLKTSSRKFDIGIDSYVLLKMRDKLK